MVSQMQKMSPFHCGGRSLGRSGKVGTVHVSEEDDVLELVALANDEADTQAGGVSEDTEAPLCHSEPPPMECPSRAT